MEDAFVTLAHGNGGRFMRELIDGIFVRHLANPELDASADAAAVALDAADLYLTTDGFTVQPLEFPGGNIGSLAVHGTVNDLAVAGAEPRYLTLNAFIEEGLEMAVLDRLVASLAEAARAAGVRIVAGDTKVLRRGEGGGVYFATTGIGVRASRSLLSLDAIRDGDAILVSGTLGDHGAAVMLAREDFGLRGDVRSDSACVLPFTRAIGALPGLRFMRDPTRGGLAAVANEIAEATGLGVRLSANLPVADAVQSVCEMLGYDPLYLASEGRVVAVIDPAEAETALYAWRALDGGAGAEIIGRIDGSSERVVLETELGGERFIEPLEDDPLPRIC